MKLNAFCFFLSAFFFLLMVNNCAAQRADLDMTRSSFNNTFWGVRVQTGIQRSYYLDAGVSKGSIKGTGIGFVCYDLFVVGSMFPSFRKETPSIYGVKCGADFGASGGVMGIEIGWYSNKLGQAFIVTPKVGFGLSFANVSYGYGFAAGTTPLTRIGGHTVVLQCSVPLKIKYK